MSEQIEADDHRFCGPAWRAYADASERAFELRVALEHAEAAADALREAAIAEVVQASTAKQIMAPDTKTR